LEWVNPVILVLAALLLVPVAVLCVECIAALLPARKRVGTRAVDARSRPRLAVLIPAHNEEKVLGATLASLMPQLQLGDRVVVVADNCDDDTPAVAREFGAEVAERHDPERRGKGYALDFGVRHLEADPPSIVIMMDADCHVHDGAIEALAAQVVETNQPAQAVYLLERPTRPGPRDLVSALAFMVKNLVRPRGLDRLGLPCLLTGTGMAFPWHAIKRVHLATGNIVEDMQLGLDLALAGHAPRFCEAARVSGKLPEQRDVALTQRRRWEHGHLRTLLTQVPRLLWGVVSKRRVGALALALEISVPPLSLLVMLILASISAAMLATKLGASWLAFKLLVGSAGVVGVCILAVWARFGRKQIPLGSLVAVPFYVLWKIPLYATFVFRPQREWVRTERTEAEAAEAAASAALANLFSGEDFPAHGQPSIVELCGINLHAIDERQCISRVLRESAAGRGGVVVTPNLDHVRRYRTDAEYALLVNKADLVVADGMPLIWASKLQGTPLPGRVAGSDLIGSLSAAAARAGRSIFLLGGDPGTADGAAEVLRRRHPGLQIVGTCCPPMGFERDAAKVNEISSMVVAAKPDIVFVALGSPKQERLIDRLRGRLPGTWWLGVGISFSFLAGEVRRAPRWMRATGMEWIHRLLQEPGRLAKRYLVHGVPFALRLLAASSVRGVGRKLGLLRRRPALAVAGMGNVEVTESDFAGFEEQQPLRLPSLGAGNGNGAEGKDLVYRSFLSGFTAEFFVEGRSGQTRMSAPPSQEACPPLQGTCGRIGVPKLLERLKAVVLLGGSVRPSKLTAAIRRSVLDLPLEDGQSILAHWREQTRELRQAIGGAVDHLHVRVMVDRLAPHPKCPPPCDDVTVLVERDLSPYRGTGGVLRDLAIEYGDDDLLLVANAAQALVSPLPELAVTLAELESDVGLLCHADGTPCGLMLVRCGALRRIAAGGYVDMKEQALPQIAKEYKVTHLYQTRASGLPVRNLDEYIGALQRRHRLSLGTPLPQSPFAEDRRPTFAIIEQGARIGKGARVLDSVVLKGAVVEEGALVVRSIICPGGTLAGGETAIDSLVINAEVAAR
jgi:exopolysaccharide biosynthesis WecB/TagA/CpsF family protein